MGVKIFKLFKVYIKDAKEYKEKLGGQRTRGKKDFGVFLESISFPYSKINSGSDEIFLIFQTSNCFHLLKRSPSWSKWEYDLLSFQLG